jgi:hypothetical protein
MRSGRAFVLVAMVLALLVMASSIWLLPAGQGPFSAVNGPTSHLKAWREASRLRSCMSLLSVATLLTALADAPPRPEVPAAEERHVPSSDRVVLVSVLTC